MKFTTLALLAGSAAAFAPASQQKASTSINAFSVKDLPGALEPMGLFDPLGFAAKADEKTLKRYREAEVTHGRVAMLATVGFLVGEKVEGSSFLFDASIHGPAITHLSQVPGGFWAILLTINLKSRNLKSTQITTIHRPPFHPPACRQPLFTFLDYMHIP